MRRGWHHDVCWKLLSKMCIHLFHFFLSSRFCWTNTNLWLAISNIYVCINEDTKLKLSGDIFFYQVEFVINFNFFLTFHLHSRESLFLCFFNFSIVRLSLRGNAHLRRHTDLHDIREIIFVLFSLAEIWNSEIFSFFHSTTTVKIYVWNDFHGSVLNI